MSLKQAADALGPEVSVKVLRREVHAGRLRCYRLRPGSNSKILVSEQDLAAWLEGVAGHRRLVPRPGSQS
ncbi:MAG: helix-turn-helix domain-containing protein [Planctomycetes bacterium]|nr:helix-turn-helix domain-containing protein [Planctomycetota bacterium]